MLPMALVPTSGELRTEVSLMAPASPALAGLTIGDGNRPMVRIRYRYDSRGRLTGLVYEPPGQ